jgi:hypothetical protein
MRTPDYDSMWIAFVQFEAAAGEQFNALIDVEDTDAVPTYLGAWANVLVESSALKEALDLIEAGLKELRFQLVRIQKIEHAALLVEEQELKPSVVAEMAYMRQHGYKFMISDRMFPYDTEQD